MTQRLQAVYDHLRGSSYSKLQTKSPDDGARNSRRPHSDTLISSCTVVITAAFRTPLCKSRKGQFKDTGSDELLISLFKAARSKIGIDPAVIGDMYEML